MDEGSRNTLSSLLHVFLETTEGEGETVRLEIQENEDKDVQERLRKGRKIQGKGSKTGEQP